VVYQIGFMKLRGPWCSFHFIAILVSFHEDLGQVFTDSIEVLAVYYMERDGWDAKEQICSYILVSWLAVITCLQNFLTSLMLLLYTL